MESRTMSNDEQRDMNDMKSKTLKDDQKDMESQIMNEQRDMNEEQRVYRE